MIDKTSFLFNYIFNITLSSRTEKIILINEATILRTSRKKLEFFFEELQPYYNVHFYFKRIILLVVRRTLSRVKRIHSQFIYLIIRDFIQNQQAKLFRDLFFTLFGCDLICAWYFTRASKVIKKKIEIFFKHFYLTFRF